MAEQGIEQAAKAGLLAGTPWVTWDKLDKTGQEFWLRIARAMQPHLARESGRLNALSSEEVDYLADIWRARNTTASLQSQLYDLFEELVERRHPHMRSVPVASDAPASEPQSAGDAETVERMLDTFDDVAMGYSAFTGEARCEAMTAALSVAREGYVPASALGPVTDEEFVAHRYLVPQLGPGTGTEGVYAFCCNDVDKLLADRLKRLTAPQAAKTPEERVTTRWNAGDEDCEILLDDIQELEARMKALEQTLRDVKKVLGMSSLCEDDIVQAAIEMIKSALEHKAERLEKEEPKP